MFVWKDDKLKMHLQKVLQNPHSLVRHQARIKCLAKEKAMHHTGSIPGEMQKGHGQDSPHRAQKILARKAPSSCRVWKHREVNWPPGSRPSYWYQFEEDASRITEAKGDIETRPQRIINGPYIMP